MKKANLLLLVFFVVVSVVSVRADDGIGLSFGVDYASNYFWRGYDFYGNEGGVFFPSLAFEPGGTGLSFSYTGEYSAESTDDDRKAFHTAGFGLDYSNQIVKDTLTLGLGVWYFWFYKSDDEKISGDKWDWSFGTGTVSLAVDALPLTPTIVYNHDYIKDDREGDIENTKDYYVQFKLGHEIELLKGATLGLEAIVSYFNNKSMDSKETKDENEGKKGISDVQGIMSISIEKSGVTFSGSFNYAFVPDKDWNIEETESGEKYNDKHRFWSGFGISYSL